MSSDENSVDFETESTGFTLNFVLASSLRSSQLLTSLASCFRSPAYRSSRPAPRPRSPTPSRVPMSERAESLQLRVLGLQLIVPIVELVFSSSSSECF